MEALSEQTRVSRDATVIETRQVPLLKFTSLINVSYFYQCEHEGVKAGCNGKDIYGW